MAGGWGVLGGVGSLALDVLAGIVGGTLALLAVGVATLRTHPWQDRHLAAAAAEHRHLVSVFRRLLVRMAKSS